MMLHGTTGIFKRFVETILLVGFNLILADQLCYTADCLIFS